MNKKLLFSYIFGTALEIYEFTVFGLMAGFLAQHFFSGYDSTVQMELIFVMFAIGFIVRPISALFYGQWGDTKGRRSPFLSTILWMAVATFMIGLLPTYAMIGWASTLLLVILRVVQGVAVSGEYAGALTLLYEQEELHQRKIYTSLSMTAPFLGMLLASMTVVLLHQAIGESALKAWGWRIPFLAALVLGVIAIWLRKKMDESPSFLKLRENNSVQKMPLKQLFKEYKSTLMVMIAIYQLSVILTYTTFVYLPNARMMLFSNEFTGVYIATSINLLIVIGLIPFFAKKFPTHKTPLVMIISASLVTALVFLLFQWSSQSEFMYFFTAQCILGILGASFVSGFPYLLSKAFPTPVRYSGNAVVLNVASGCFAGITPYLLTLITDVTGSSVMPAIYMIGASLLSLSGLIYLKNAKRFRSSVEEKAIENAQ